jgi:hypothetical protein
MYGKKCRRRNIWEFSLECNFRVIFGWELGNSIELKKASPLRIVLECVSVVDGERCGKFVFCDQNPLFPEVGEMRWVVLVVGVPVTSVFGRWGGSSGPVSVEWSCVKTHSAPRAHNHYSVLTAFTHSLTPTNLQESGENGIRMMSWGLIGLEAECQGSCPSSLSLSGPLCSLPNWHAIININYVHH